MKRKEATLFICSTNTRNLFNSDNMRSG